MNDNILGGWDEVLERFLPQGEDQFDIFHYGETLIAALIFGLILRALYTLYFRDNEPQDGSLARSLVMITPALATIFWLIQTSVVLSLGLLGSMSFVRYRTPVKRSEDVAFIILALAAAICSATHNFGIGIVLMLVFLAFSLVRSYFGEGFVSSSRFAVLTINTKRNILAADINKGLKDLRIKSEFVSSRSYDGITSLVFNVPRLKEDRHDELKARLESFDKDAHINIFFPNDRLGV